MEKWTTRRRMHYLPVCWALVALASLGAAPPIAGPKPADPDRPPPPLAPTEAARRFKVADGLAIGLAASEPEVTQPLSISFDDRGRMWVLQYRQYPLPEGLKAVRMDQYLRTKYDRVPAGVRLPSPCSRPWRRAPSTPRQSPRHNFARC